MRMFGNNDHEQGHFDALHQDDLACSPFRWAPSLQVVQTFCIYPVANWLIIGSVPNTLRRCRESRLTYSISMERTMVSFLLVSLIQPSHND